MVMEKIKGHEDLVKLTSEKGVDRYTTKEMLRIERQMYEGNGGVVNGVVTGSCRGFDPYTAGGQPYSPIGIFTLDIVYVQVLIQYHFLFI